MDILKLSVNLHRQQLHSLAVCALAFACIEAWFLLFFWNISLFGDVSEGSVLFSEAYTVATVAFFAALVILAVAPGLTNALRKHAILFVCIAFGMSLVTVAFFINTALLQGNAIGVSAIACCVVAGALSAFYFIAVGLYLANFKACLLMQSVFAGLALSALIYCLAIALPIVGYALVVAVLPLLSCAALAQVGRISPAAVGEQRDNASELGPDWTACDAAVSGPSACFPQLALRAPRCVQLSRLTLCALLVGFTNETNRFLYNEIASPIIDAAMFRFSQDIAALVIVFFCAVCAIALHFKDKSQFLHLLFWGIFTLLFVATIALPATLLFPDVESAYLVFTALSSASYECFSLLIWIGPGLIVSRDISYGTRAFTLVRLGWSGGQLLGIMMVSAFAATLAVQNLYLYSAASCVILVISFAIIFPESVLSAMLLVRDEREREEPSILLTDDDHDTLKARCCSLAALHGISQRELDVMELLSEGRNAAYIMDKLVLSRSTVSTHRQHVYQKLGIHSQQELIEMVQGGSRRSS